MHACSGFGPVARERHRKLIKNIAGIGDLAVIGGEVKFFPRLCPEIRQVREKAKLGLSPSLPLGGS